MKNLRNLQQTHYFNERLGKKSNLLDLAMVVRMRYLSKDPSRALFSNDMRNTQIRIFLIPKTQKNKK